MVMVKVEQEDWIGWCDEAAKFEVPRTWLMVFLQKERKGEKETSSSSSSTRLYLLGVNSSF